VFVIPCVDILDGQCVQLVGGKPETGKAFGNPFDWLENWCDEGADLVHIIDLNATLGTGSNRDIIKQLIGYTDARVQVGGGIRDMGIALDLAGSGAERIILGSRALDQSFMEDLASRVPRDRIMAALDTIDGKVGIKGWQERTNIPLETAFNLVKPFAGSILVTNVDREGLMGGPDTSQVASLVGNGVPIYVSGGFASKDDLTQAREAGFAGVVVGKALFEGKMSLKELW